MDINNVATDAFVNRLTQMKKGILQCNIPWMCYVKEKNPFRGKKPPLKMQCLTFVLIKLSFYP